MSRKWIWLEKGNSSEQFNCQIHVKWRKWPRRTQLLPFDVTKKSAKKSFPIFHPPVPASLGASAKFAKKRRGEKLWERERERDFCVHHLNRCNHKWKVKMKPSPAGAETYWNLARNFTRSGVVACTFISWDLYFRLKSLTIKVNLFFLPRKNNIASSLLQSKKNLPHSK